VNAVLAIALLLSVGHPALDTHQVHSGSMWGTTGALAPVNPSGSVAPPLTIAALPYARTVTCTGAITLTGTATGAGAVSWAASPDGASGSCTGTTSWSCAVSVSPNAAGEGVETITVSQAGGGSASVDVGFYVAGAHSCFLAQSINGTYNSGLVDADAVGTWVNLGSSAKNVTQATGSARPTYRTSVVGGQPVVRCDGGDRLVAATASDWTFLHDGTGATIDGVTKTTSAAIQNVMTTTTTGSAVGIRYRYNSASTVSYFFADGAASVTVTGNSTSGAFDQLTSTTASADTPDLTLYVDNVSVGTPIDAPSFPVVAPTTALSVCATSAGVSPFTGDLFRAIIYASSLTSTQRGINLAVDEWALGGTLPVTP
jgi:hypothetical protein